jgi:hypothetical protein
LQRDTVLSFMIYIMLLLLSTRRPPGSKILLRPKWQHWVRPKTGPDFSVLVAYPITVAIYSALQLLSLCCNVTRGVDGKPSPHAQAMSPLKTLQPPLPSTIRTLLGCHPSPPTHMSSRMVDADEGNSSHSLTCCPAALPEDLFPSSLRPPAPEPGLIRLPQPRFIGHANARRRYPSIRISNWRVEILH